MLTLPPFELRRPTSFAAAASLLAEAKGNARLVAGGTDILVNMKHGLLAPTVLVDLTAVEDATGVRVDDDGTIRIGALTTLAALEVDPVVRSELPALAQAAGLVAGPQLRNMGTIGGNLCLDTRCVYINQTHFWRQSLGYCLKKDGTVCHVVANGKRCVAAQSSDTVPVLIAFDAEVRIVGAEGTRIAPVESLYRRDGEAHITLAPDEIVAEVLVAPRDAHTKSAYQKLRVRQAIDYPALSVAAVVTFDDLHHIQSVAVVGTALMATPRRLGGADRWVGRPLDETVIEEIAERAHKQFVPMTNINVDPEWRREMVPVFVKRALRGLAASASPGPSIGPA